MKFTLLSKTPKWVSGLTTDQYHAFSKMLLERSDGLLKTAHAKSDGTIVLGDGQINLVNLTSTCANLPEADWPAEIDNFVSALVVGDESLDYEKYKDEVIIQLYPYDYFGQVEPPDTPVVRNDIPGLLTTIVIDTPTKLISLIEPPESEWHKNAEKLFKVALHKLQVTKPEKVEFMELPSSAGEPLTVSVIESDEINGAAQALVLEELYPDLIGKQGALIALPLRNLIIVRRIDKDCTQEEITAIRSAVKYLASQNSGYLSSYVYYLKNAKIKVV